MFSSIAIHDAIVGGSGVVNMAKVYLVESDEELYMVRLLFGYDFRTVYEVNVRKMDFSKQQWCRVHDLCGRAFLVSPSNFGACARLTSVDYMFRSFTSNTDSLKAKCYIAITNSRYKYLVIQIARVRIKTGNGEIKTEE